MDQLQLYFQGVFYVDPPTANNNLIDDLLDIRTTNLTNYWQSLTDEALTASLTSLEEKLEPQLNGRTAPTQQLPSYWNYYGSYGFWFDQVTITGSNLFLQDDPLIGTAVSLRGQEGTKAIMVQIDPTDSTSAQIFSGLFTMGQTGCSLTGESPSLAYLRGLHFPRNLKPADVPEGTSAVFQSIITPEDITIDNQDNSQLLQLLADGLAQGLNLRFLYCLYYTQPPPLSPAELAAAYAAGQTPHNPKQGHIIGLITLAEPNPLPSVPPGRLLQSPYVFDPANRQQIPLGQALITVDYTQSQMQLNFISTIPEVDSSLEKLSLGDGILQVVDSNNVTQTIGVITYSDYNKQAYDALAGQIALPFDPSLSGAIKNGRMQMIFPQAQQIGPNPLLTEVIYDIQTEARVIYFYSNEPQTIEVYVSYLGQPAARTSVAIGQWRSNIQDAGARAAQPTQPDRGYIVSKGYDQSVLTFEPAIAITNEAGVATFTLHPNSEGAARLYFWVPGKQEEPQNTAEFAMGSISYATARVFATDEELDTILNPDWVTVYDNVLRYFAILYPGMNQIFSLSDPDAVKEHAEAILYRMDRQKWHTTLYMPTSRELTVGRENLLRRWLQQFVDPPPVVQIKTEKPGTPSTDTDDPLGSLSNRLR